MKHIAFQALRLAFAAGVFAAGCLASIPPALAAPPAFLDAPNQVTLWMETPTTVAALTGQVTVQCGQSVIPVSRVEAIAGMDHKNAVVLAGTFQSALGGSDWTADDSRTQMHEVQPGVFELQARLPPGRYQYKLTRGGWAENYGAGFLPGGPNIVLVVPDANTPVLFRADFNRKTIQTSLDTPGLLPSKTMQPPAAEASQIFHLLLSRTLKPAEISLPLSVRFQEGTARPLFARDILSGPEYFYGGDDLGARYSPASTTFKVWSPVSSSADLLLYPNTISAAPRRVPLRRESHGVWSATVPGDLHGTYYQYRFMSYGVQRTAPDLYGRAASADLQRSMVVDLPRTDPAGWHDIPLPHLAKPTDAVVYEAHIRDFTIDPSSGVDPALRGTYEGLIAPNTHVPGTEQPTGLDYLRQLGVTHLQLMPFQSIAPARNPGYNWGYATDLYNVPEPRYATRPGDPAGVIREAKTMIASLHRAGLGVVMDVVYNHSMPAGGDTSPFWATVPYYYFRTGPQGDLLNESGVGNALDDDHPMVRKFVCDSLAYWATQYHVDGFRFDLLGMFTPQTVRAISQTLHELRPDILLYGEPWTGGGPIRFGKGAQRGLGVAVFNDNIRSLVRGDLNGTVPGFALGGDTDAQALQAAISGSPDFADAPTESINYVSIHDDMTLRDKISQALPGSKTRQRQALKLAGAIVLLSQGVPVLEGGAEMGRTKGGSSNSYNLGDAANHFDWKRGLEFADTSDYYRGLIAVRRAHPVFRCATAEDIHRTLAFLPPAALPPKTVAFTLDGTPSGDPWRKTLVIFHGATDPGSMTLPPGRWHLAVTGEQARTGGDVWPGPSLPLAPLSASVLYQEAETKP